MTMPLLIGGATTSAKHTAVEIAPSYSRAGGALARRLGVGAGGREPARSRKAGQLHPKNTEAQERDRTHLCRSAATNAGALRGRAWPAALQTDWATVRIDEPAFLGLRFARSAATGETRPLHRLVAVLPNVGAAGQVPANLRRSAGRGGGAQALRRCAAIAQADRRGETAHGAGRVRLLAGQFSGRRHPGLRRSDSRSTNDRPLSHAAAAMGAQGAVRVSLAGRLHRAARQRSLGLLGGVRGDDRHWLRRAAPPSSRARTTITWRS